MLKELDIGLKLPSYNNKLDAQKPPELAAANSGGYSSGREIRNRIIRGNKYSKLRKNTSSICYGS